MWDKISKGLQSLLTGVVIKSILTEETKRKVVNQLNAKINIPVMSEKDEAQLIGYMWDAVEQAIKDVLKVQEDK
tara:strand:- start:296 stop:517 length:222 start_codon:yes stop_codon:yes gene_type:complete